MLRTVGAFSLLDGLESCLMRRILSNPLKAKSQMLPLLLLLTVGGVLLVPLSRYPVLPLENFVNKLLALFGD